MAQQQEGQQHCQEQQRQFLRCPDDDDDDHNNNNNNNKKKKKVLVVTCDLPSHPYAAAKLSKVLVRAGDYDVTLAAPEGSADDRIRREVSSDDSAKSWVRCITVGTVSTVKPMNYRAVTNPNSWRTFWESLKHPFLMASAANEMFDEQEGMYEPMKSELRSGRYDLVVAMHSVVSIVADAAESVAKEDNESVISVAIFSSLPYDPAMHLDEIRTWNHPRSLTAFPHVSAYSSIPPSNAVAYVKQRLWQALDAVLTRRAWSRSAAHNNARRARRGLDPIPNGWKGYLERYHCICFGGVFPYIDTDSPIAPNVTVIGSIESHPTPLEGDLLRWLSDAAAKDGIVYASFGTGTELNEAEAAAIAGDMVRGLEGTPYPLLIALRVEEQARLRNAIDAAVGSPPTKEADCYLEYLGGRLRIEADVPQSSLLSSGRVRLFLSHMGMGGFVEGCKGGIPFIAYPSGCDQWFNAQRAVDAGIAVQAPYGLDNVSELVQQALKDKRLLARAKAVSRDLSKINGEILALQAIDRLIAAKSVTFDDDSLVAYGDDKSSFKLPAGSYSCGSFSSALRRRVPTTYPAQAA